MRKTDKYYSEYRDKMETFNNADKDTKKRLLVELLVFNGYNITEYCKQFNDLKMSSVRKQYKEQLQTYLNYR